MPKNNTTKAAPPAAAIDIGWRMYAGRSTLVVSSTGEPHLEPNHLDGWIDPGTFATTESFEAPKVFITTTDQQIQLPFGLTIVMGVAGSGKTEFVRTLMRQMPEGEAALVPYLETEYTDAAATPTEFALRFASAVTNVSENNRVIFIDSVRSWFSLGTGFPARLMSAGVDSTMFAAMTQWDLFARRRQIALVAVLYIDETQIRASRLVGVDGSLATALRALHASADGAASMTVLCGPSRHEAGSFELRSRLDRREAPFVGSFAFGDDVQPKIVQPLIVPPIRTFVSKKLKPVMRTPEPARSINNALTQLDQLASVSSMVTED